MLCSIVNFSKHLTSILWPSSISGNCDKFQEITENISGNLQSIFELWKPHSTTIQEVIVTHECGTRMCSNQLPPFVQTNHAL